MKEKKQTRAGIIVALAFLLLFIGNYCQYQLSPLSYLIIPKFGLSNSEFSSIFTAAMIPGMLLSLVSGILCDKFGVRRCIGIASIISLIALMFRIWSASYGSLMFCMLLAGVGVTFVNSNVAKLLGTLYPAEKIGTMLGITLAGTTAATTVAMGSTAIMFKSLKSAYTFAAILGVIIVITWLIFAGKDSAIKVEKEEKFSIITNLKTVMKSFGTWRCGICLLFLMGGSVAISTFLPLILQNIKEMSAESSSIITSIILLGNLIGTILGPILCEKIKVNVKIILSLFQVIAFVGIASVLVLPSGILLYIVMFITGFCIYAPLPVLTSIPVQLPEIGSKYAGTAGGFVATLQLIGCVCIPTYIISTIAGSNYYLMIIMISICFVGCAIMVWTLPNFNKK